MTKIETSKCSGSGREASGESTQLPDATGKGGKAICPRCNREVGYRVVGQWMDHAVLATHNR